MEIKTCIKGAFSVIGKEGSTNDGAGFVRKLWEDANSHYHEIECLVKKDGDGRPAGFWGAMSDFSRQFNPWENFAKGLYLAGAFSFLTNHLKENGITLAGAIHDFMSPAENGQQYIFAPAKKL